MAEKKQYSNKLVEIGKLLTSKRKLLGPQYSTREKFIEKRSEELFAGEQWISPRHLANIELGKNWLSIEKLIMHAYALEMDPVELFREILAIYSDTNKEV